jgi:hypothetical protein
MHGETHIKDKIVSLFKMHLQANPMNMTNLLGSLVCSVVKMRMKMITIMTKMKKKKKKKSTEESTNKTESFQWLA